MGWKSPNICVILGLASLLGGCAGASHQGKNCAYFAEQLQPYRGQDVQSLMLVYEKMGGDESDLHLEITNDRELFDSSEPEALLIEIEDPPEYTNAGFSRSRVKDIECVEFKTT